MEQRKRFGARASVGALALASAVAAEAGPYDDPQEYAMIVALFEIMQPRSFELEAELCGYIVEDSYGNLRITGPVVGNETSCAAPWPAWGTPVASWHTHGAYDPDSYSELPSDVDVETDADEEVDGWVATPGGRLWHVDGDALSVVMVCGRDCLPSDPDYNPDETGSLKDFYDLEALLERLEE